MKTTFLQRVKACNLKVPKRHREVCFERFVEKFYEWCEWAYYTTGSGSKRYVNIVRNDSSNFESKLQSDPTLLDWMVEEFVEWFNDLYGVDADEWFFSKYTLASRNITERMRDKVESINLHSSDT